jgi:hypothetical protein
MCHSDTQIRSGNAKCMALSGHSRLAAEPSPYRSTTCKWDNSHDFWICVRCRYAEYRHKLIDNLGIDIYMLSRRSGEVT